MNGPTFTCAAQLVSHQHHYAHFSSSYLFPPLQDASPPSLFHASLPKFLARDHVPHLIDINRRRDGRSTSINSVVAILFPLSVNAATFSQRCGVETELTSFRATPTLRWRTF